MPWRTHIPVKNIDSYNHKTEKLLPDKREVLHKLVLNKLTSNNTVSQLFSAITPARWKALAGEFQLEGWTGYL